VDLGAVVVTAIDRDGMLGGPDVVGLRAALALTAHPVVASGGVCSPSDLAELAGLETRVEGEPGLRRLAGAIVGTALVEGAMTVEEAIAACVLSV
jgi:phosphoribosylformimino-5-aminoimidazole carboxamide ribonucleotide (ProFAR) isomerase